MSSLHVYTIVSGWLVPFILGKRFPAGQENVYCVSDPVLVMFAFTLVEL